MSQSRTGRMVITIAMVLLLVLAAACAPADAETLQGVLKNVDSVNGEVTIVTKDGKTVTVKIATETKVTTNGTSSSSEILEPGDSVDIEVKKDNRVARHIKVVEKVPSALAAVGWGIIEIRVTDPPPADVKSAVVYLTNIEVHKVSGNASDNASGWLPIIGAPVSFDLMDVIGVEKILGSANITAGSFTQIRMDVDRVEGITTDNVSYTAEVPGEKLKIAGAFNVGGGTQTVLTLDFDGEKSLIRTGQGKFLFKPVVKLLINKGGDADERKGGETGRPSETGKPGERGEGKGNSGEGKKP